MHYFGLVRVGFMMDKADFRSLFFLVAKPLKKMVSLGV
jgi:hypothetical protein